MISQYLGFDSDYIIIGLAALVLILIIGERQSASGQDRHCHVRSE